jgi:hypothetical protein
MDERAGFWHATLVKPRVFEGAWQFKMTCANVFAIVQANHEGTKRPLQKTAVAF